jgi:hypothetical protein
MAKKQITTILGVSISYSKNIKQKYYAVQKAGIFFVSEKTYVELHNILKRQFYKFELRDFMRKIIIVSDPNGVNKQ